MSKFQLLTTLGLVTLLAVGFTDFASAGVFIRDNQAEEDQEIAVEQSDDAYIASTEQYGKVSITRVMEPVREQLVLEVIYEPSGGNEKTKHTSRIILKEFESDQKLTFETKIDKKSGHWCIYDRFDARFVFIAYPPNEENLKAGQFRNFWHPGVHIGWGRGLWIDHYKKVRINHPSLPYPGFVSERFLVK